ncbi:hypothetical protein DXG03_003344 [Asterophora parasitica]|uniref:Uncharacterized protein n=1 Tax=Asterophora parasitica TaxID=117018 RepID=A0A9P7G2V2_9AGAR|nr:hypothetical protein DXG03_003344 [Asterophora parasitica]
MLLEPGVPEDHVLFAQTGDHEESTLGVIVTEHRLYHILHRAGFIGSAIDIVDWDGTMKGAGGKSVSLDKSCIKETASSSAVNQRLNGEHLLRVGGFEFHLQLERSFGHGSNN